MHNYPGNPATYPANVGLIDDSDAPDASNFNVAPTNLADRTAFLHDHYLPLAGGIITGLVEFGATSTLQFDVGSTLTGTVSAGTLTLATAARIIVAAGADIISNTAGGIESIAAGGILSSVIGGIAPGIAGGISDGGIAGGIAASVAGGIASGVVGGIELTGGPTDWPTFPTRTKSVSFPLQALNAVDVVAGGNWHFSSGALIGQVTSLALLLKLDNPHEGANLNSLAITFYTPTPHAAAATKPSLSVYRLRLNPGGAASSPQFLSATDPQFATWVNTANQQTLLYTTDQNFTIDNVNYVYFVSLTDEHGAGSVAGTVYTGMTATYGNIADMRFPG